jgi:hypothetical protein
VETHGNECHNKSARCKKSGSFQTYRTRRKTETPRIRIYHRMLLDAEIDLPVSRSASFAMPLRIEVIDFINVLLGIGIKEFWISELP